MTLQVQIYFIHTERSFEEKKKQQTQFLKKSYLTFYSQNFIFNIM